MNANEIVLHPPAGVAINQWKDSSIHFRCGAAGYLPLAELFHQLSVQCRVYAEAYKTQTGVETQMQTASPGPGAEERIADLTNEIARLRGIGVPVSVNTNPNMTAAQQLAAAVVTRNPVTVAPPGPSLMEVANAMATRNVQHPVAAAAAVAVPSPIIPPANVPPQPAPPPFVAPMDLGHKNTGPALAGVIAPPVAPIAAKPVIDPRIARMAQLKAELAALEAPIELPSVDANVIHKPILRQPAAGIADPSAPGTIVSGGREADNGELGLPPEGI